MLRKSIALFSNSLIATEEKILAPRGSLFKLLLLSTFMGGAYLRIKGLTFQSLWYDEIGTLSYYNSDHTLLEVIRASTNDHFLPLFNILLWSCFKIFGTSVEAGRGLTALFGILTLVVCFLIGKDSKDSFTGWCVLLVVAVNPGLIYYSQEMRPYALMILLLCCAYLYLMKFLQTQKSGHLYLFTFFCLLSMYTHFFAFVGILHFLIILVLNRKQIQNRAALINALSISCLALAPVAFNTLGIFSEFGRSANRWTSIRGASIGRLASIASDWLGKILIPPTLILLVLGIFKKDKEIKRPYAWIGYQAIILFSIFLALELMLKPFVQARYFLWIDICIAIQTGIRLAKIRRFRLLLPTVLLVCALSGLIIEKSFYWVQTKGDYRTMLTSLHNDPNTPIACFSRHSSGIIKYYEILFKEKPNTLSKGRLPNQNFYLFWDRPLEKIQQVDHLKLIKQEGQAHLFYVKENQLQKLPNNMINSFFWGCE